MAINREPSERWQFANVQAWAFVNGQALAAPVVLAAYVQAGPTEMAALVAGLDHDSYSFLSALCSAGRDLVLVGYTDGNAGLVKNASPVPEAVSRTLAAKVGLRPLKVGGLRRGALMARYGLARMECDRRDHETAVYFPYNGTAPSSDEVDTLNQVGLGNELGDELATLLGDDRELVTEAVAGASSLGSTPCSRPSRHPRRAQCPAQGGVG